MEDKLYSLLEELKALIANDERVLKLNELENIMNNDESAMRLSYQVDMLSIKFNDILKIYPLESKEAKEAQRALYLKKKELDSLPSVLAYKKQYQEVSKIYEKINKEIFFPFKETKCHKKAK